MDCIGWTATIEGMARAHGIAIVSLIAIGTASWLILAQQDESPLPPDNSGQMPPDEAESPPVIEPQRTAVGRAHIDVTGSDETPKTSADVTEPTAPEPPPEAQPNVQLVVLQRAEQGFAHEPVKQFRWRYQPAGSPAVKGPGPDNGMLTLPAGTRGVLLVEADGFTPDRQRVEIPAESTAPLVIDIFLDPQARQSGVWISARDPLGAGVEQLCIDLWRLPADQPDPAPGIDPKGRTMWTRIGKAPGGRCRLPNLDAGRYALRAQPCDADGTPLPLLPQRSVFRFTGNEHIPLQYDFLPGQVLTIESQNGSGQEQKLRATVRSRDGSQVPVWWRSHPPQGTPRVSLNSVTMPGRATSLLALPRDDYALQLTDDDGQPLSVMPAAGGTADLRPFTLLLRR